MIQNKKQIKTLDLFSGCGGSSCGANESGVNIVAAVDAWPLARDTYIENFKNISFYCDFIENINPADIENKVGKIDLILASPECTSHTCARGNNPGSESSRMTAFEVLRFARILKPRWIVIENVVHMRKWKRYKELIDTLEKELKYQVRVQTLTASAFGVPQSRRRLFITCDKKEMPPVITPSIRARRKTVKDIIENDADYPFSQLVTEKRAKATLERAERAFSEVGKDKSFLLVYYGSDAAGGWQSIDKPLRTVTTVDRFAYVKPSDNGHLMRMLQVPEIKAAMGFPSQFKMPHGTRREKIHMLGNAVCPPVMEHVIRSLTHKPQE